MMSQMISASGGTRGVTGKKGFSERMPPSFFLQPISTQLACGVVRCDASLQRLIGDQRASALIDG